MTIGAQLSALREDFVHALEARTSVKFAELPDEKKAELAKLQGSAESFEAIFVKGLLDQMRRVRFAESPSPVREMAEDMAHQAMAEQAARGRPGLGLARLVFLDTAQSIVRTAPRPDTTQP
jgi:Rod binding domain-containing protein